MSSSVAKIEPSNLQVVPSGAVITADEWNERRIAFIRENYANKAPDPEFDAFITICKRRGLAPEEKQIYLIPRAGKWTVQTSIDGYRLIAERSGLYAGSDDPVYEVAPDRLLDGKGKEYPLKATVTVWKIVNGVRCPFTSSAYWAEYTTGQNLWISHPFVMLAKCAESQALRKAFPADLSGIYTIEEMDQAAAPAPANGGRAKASVSESTGGAMIDWTAFWKRAKTEYGIGTADALTQATGLKIASFGGNPQAAWDALVAAKGAGASPAPEPDVIDVDGIQADAETGEIVEPVEAAPSAETKTAKKAPPAFGDVRAAAADKYTS